MPFYIMKQDMFVSGSAMVDGLPESMDPLALLQASPLPTPQEAPIVSLSEESGDFRGHIIGGFATLYSDALRDALDRLGVNNVRYLPVRLMNPNTRQLEDGYSLIKITDVLDCVDMEKSKVKWWRTGNGFDFESMVIDEAKTNGAKIFRLKEDPTKVIINEEVMRHLEEADVLDGIELIQTEDYSDW